MPRERGSGGVFRLNGDEVLGNLNLKDLAVGLVELLLKGGVLDLHLTGIAFALEDLGGHLTGDKAQIIVGDGQRHTAAAGAEVLLTRDHGDLLLQNHVVNELGVGGGGVVGGDVEHVALGAATSLESAKV